MSRAPQETCKLIIPKLLSELFSLISLNIGKACAYTNGQTHFNTHQDPQGYFQKPGDANPMCNWSFLAMQDMLFLFVSFVPSAQLKPPFVSDNLSVSLFKIMTAQVSLKLSTPLKRWRKQKKNHRNFLPQLRPVVPPSFVSDIVGNVAKIPIERQRVYK